MITLLNVPITTAQTAVAVNAQPIFTDFLRTFTPHTVLLQGNFTYGSGGTTADAYVQSSADGGATWVDIANFHFTTSSGIRLFNLRADTSVTSQATPTDGSLTANTAVDGLLGDLLRVKWVTTGTYAGGTTLVVTAVIR